MEQSEIEYTNFVVTNNPSELQNHTLAMEFSSRFTNCRVVEIFGNEQRFMTDGVKSKLAFKSSRDSRIVIRIVGSKGVHYMPFIAVRYNVPARRVFRRLDTALEESFALSVTFEN